MGSGRSPAPPPLESSRMCNSPDSPDTASNLGEPDMLYPAPRRTAWLLGRRFMLAIETGDLPRMRSIAAEAEFAHLDEPPSKDDPREVWLTKISPSMGKLLYVGAMVETLWELSMCRRSEVAGLEGMNAWGLAWCDDLLVKKKLKWMPEGE